MHIEPREEEREGDADRALHELLCRRRHSEQKPPLVGGHFPANLSCALGGGCEGSLSGARV